MTRAAALLVGALHLFFVADLPAARTAHPDYLPYVDFAANDTPEQVALKQAYNQSAQRYNQALYDYLVTLEKHDWLVELHNRSTDRDERERARTEARPLRQQLQTLRNSVNARAAAVREAARRAAAAGIPLR